MRTSGKILRPQTRQRVGRSIEVQGELDHVRPGDHFWIVVRVARLFWPKEPEIPNRLGAFKVTVYEGGNPPDGLFSIVLLRVSSDGHEFIQEWIKRGRETGDYPGIATISGATELDSVEVRL